MFELRDDFPEHTVLVRERITRAECIEKGLDTTDEVLLRVLSSRIRRRVAGAAHRCKGDVKWVSQPELEPLMYVNSRHASAYVAFWDENGDPWKPPETQPPPPLVDPEEDHA